ncbi:hypothetical protein E7Z59_00595 [Robertkochia marina]|uniref:MerC domain-containing protein n=1 Tax=Robertkochia marina TaxID=1227945 RepID=A0A4S3M3K0_9FLAO|nr:hypothetical protein [Robertkochia marina]THD68861.1 hypothetical protein E7Z59_00595 [Robertkochia marina]TRZ41107.1 hypothetical protein D3A96_13870 [Robertkochia marina]
MKPEKTSCCNAEKAVAVKNAPTFKSGFMSFLSTALIIIIPKCPFCIAAYAGSILMFFDIEIMALQPIVDHGKPVLGLIIIALIAFNYNVKKSKVALGIALAAMTVLLLTTYGKVYIVPEWMIYLAFFFAAWYNGNFKYFYSFLRRGRQVSR